MRTQVLVPHSLSLAWRLGRAVTAAQHAKRDPVAAVAEEAGGRVLFVGEWLSCSTSSVLSTGCVPRCAVL